jgi:GT2 family glycosyltransferase
MPQLSFSIIVPTRDRPDRLSECLNALSLLDYPAHRFEVIVVDDGTTSANAVEKALHPSCDKLNISLLAQKQAGPATARNHGASKAAYDGLAFTDDDCRPRPGWLKAFERQLMASPKSIAGGETLNALHDNLYAEASQILTRYLYDYFQKKGTPFLASNNMALSRELFARLGGFNERFVLAGGEDREFCDRCVAEGLKLAYVPEAAVDHHHRLTLSGFLRQHFRYGRGAFVYHGLRAARSDGNIRFEPARFYTDLLKFPYRQTAQKNKIAIAGLLILSQAMNMAGYYREKWKGEKNSDAS